MCNAIAALRDIGAELHCTATDAQSNAEEDDDGDDAVGVDPEVRFAPLSEWFTPPEDK